MGEKSIKKREGLPGAGAKKDLKEFDITDKDMALGLRYVKSKVRMQFKYLAKKYHPDTNQGLGGWGGSKAKGATFNKLKQTRDKILGLKIMPVTWYNVESVLEITKGYKSTTDTVLPWE